LTIGTLHRKRHFPRKQLAAFPILGSPIATCYPVSWRSNRANGGGAREVSSGETGTAMSDDLTKLLQAEEAKRLRNWDPAERWKVLQETLG
jgi:hypothetical protein